MVHCYEHVCWGGRRWAWTLEFEKICAVCCLDPHWWKMNPKDLLCIVSTTTDREFSNSFFFAINNVYQRALVFNTLPYNPYHQNGRVLWDIAFISSLLMSIPTPLLSAHVTWISISTDLWHSAFSGWEVKELGMWANIQQEHLVRFAVQEPSPTIRIYIPP